MLTRTAFGALYRLSQGKRAFATMLSQERRIFVAEQRRDALEALHAERFVTRTKSGPKVTASGKAYLASVLRGVKPAEIYGNGMTEHGRDAAATAAARRGKSVHTLRRRAQRLRRAIAAGIESV